MRTSRCASAFLLVSLILECKVAEAQFVFTEPYSVRSSAMGLSGSADVYDAANVFYNPAVLGVIEGAELGFTYSNPLAYLSDEISFLSVGVSGGHRYALEGGGAISVAIDLRLAEFDFGDFVITDPQGNILWSEKSSERAYGVSGAVAFHVGEAFYVGIGGSVKPLDIENSPLGVNEPDFKPTLPDGDGTAFDVGIVVGGRSGDEWSVAPSLGISLVNIGDDIALEPQTSGAFTVQNRVELPEAFRVGTCLRVEGPPNRKVSDALGVEVPELSVSINGEFQDPEGEDNTVVGGGVELGVCQIAFVRAGFRDIDWYDSKVTWGLGVGLPYRSVRLRFDYARHTPFDGRDAINRFGGVVALVF